MIFLSFREPLLRACAKAAERGRVVTADIGADKSCCPWGAVVYQPFPRPGRVQYLLGHGAVDHLPVKAFMAGFDGEGHRGAHADAHALGAWFREAAHASLAVQEAARALGRVRS